MSFKKEVYQATHAWAGKGDKRLRALQREVMMEFIIHAEISGARAKGQVGKSTVVNFWKKQRLQNISFESQMIYWNAINELWIIWEKLGEPPRPR